MYGRAGGDNNGPGQQDGPSQSGDGTEREPNVDENYPEWRVKLLGRKGGSVGVYRTCLLLWGYLLAYTVKRCVLMNFCVRVCVRT